MKYHVKLKKNLKKRGARHLEKRRAHHLKKGRACQEDPSNKKIEVCDKIISSCKVTHLSLSLLYLSIKITPSKVSCKTECITRQITKEVKL